MIYPRLRAFHAVAAHGGFTAGARALGIGQPTATLHVKALERTFGVQLFHRDKKRVTMTSAGQALFGITQRLFRIEAEASDLLDGLAGLRRGRLSIGAVGPHHVTAMISEFSARHPNVQISVTMRNSHEIEERLLDHRDDIATLSHQITDPHIYSVHYFTSPIVVFVNVDHPWAQRRSLRIRELDGQKVIFRERGSTTRRVFEEALQKAGVEVNPIIEIGSREGVWMTVQKGIGIGFVSEVGFASHPRLRMLRIADADIRTHTYVACLAERRHSKEIRAFFDVVESLLERNARTSAAAGR